MCEQTITTASRYCCSSQQRPFRHFRLLLLCCRACRPWVRAGVSNTDFQSQSSKPPATPHDSRLSARSPRPSFCSINSIISQRITLTIVLDAQIRPPACLSCPCRPQHPLVHQFGLPDRNAPSGRTEVLSDPLRREPSPPALCTARPGTAGAPPPR